jgi:hypothetical protein
MTAQPAKARPAGVGVLPLGIALAVTLLLAYVACWLVAASAFGAPFAHAWLALFSAAPAGSIEQLVEGSIYSVVAAWFAGLVFAPVYNLVAKADRVI